MRLSIKAGEFVSAFDRELKEIAGVVTRGVEQRVNQLAFVAMPRDIDVAGYPGLV